MTSNVTADGSSPWDALSRTIAVINGKGGVGKTSVVSGLGGLYAAAGYRVLLVGLDPQGNLADDLGYVDAEKDDRGASLLRAVPVGGPLEPVNVRPNLDVVPDGHYLDDLASILTSRHQRDSTQVTALAVSLAQVAGDYDLVFLDCPPGSFVLQESALVAARWVLIPTKTDKSSRRGLREVAERFTAARELNPQLELLGVVLFAVTSSATRVQEAARTQIAQALGDSAPVLRAWIRGAEAAAFDARERGEVVHELEAALLAEPAWYQALRDPSLPRTRLASSATTLAGDYQALAAEVLNLLSDRENETAAEELA